MFILARRVTPWWVSSACLLAVVAAGAWRPLSAAQEGRPVVYVVSIHGMIDMGLAPFLDRVLGEAQRAGAAAVVLDINTFGGRVDAAVAMRDTILKAPLRTIAFVNPRAISAGALIALASETIVIASAGTIGAAMPVVGGGAPAQAADEKTVSYLRKEFGTTAQHRKRPRELAEAMVDVDVEIPGLVAKGKLLTLTTSEALERGLAEHRAESVDGALRVAGLAHTEVRRAAQTWAETVVRFVTHPTAASLLMSVGLLGILVEIRTPGFGVPGAVGLVSLALVFWGHWIVRLAGWEELLLVLAGVILLGLEVFVVPGFGVAGIAGVVALVAGLAMVLIGAGAAPSAIIGALGRVALAILAALVGALLVLRFLPRLPFGRDLVLATEMQAERGYASAPEGDRLWLGRSGTALSALRPAGIAEIGGTRVDVVSEGGFIEAGAALEVSRVDGNRIVVRERPTQKGTRTS